jgi:hypothetical protein
MLEEKMESEQLAAIEKSELLNILDLKNSIIKSNIQH